MFNLAEDTTELAKLRETNDKIQRELKRMREENRKLKHIISYGNISTLSTLVDQYMDYSRVHLKKIAHEIQLTDYEQESTDKVPELIEHLEYVKMELHKLISVSEEGRVIMEIIPELESIMRLNIDESRNEEMTTLLKEFTLKFRKFF